MKMRPNIKKNDGKWAKPEKGAKMGILKYWLIVVINDENDRHKKTI